ncbi:MAG: SPOR domain-containing protein [Porticoccus sp.]
MTRDYAKKSSGRRTTKRQTKKRSGHQGAPGWLWLLAGVLIGALVMALTQLSEVSPEDVEKAARETGTDSQEEDDGPKPRFDFYTLLRDSEVIVPDTPDTNNTSNPPVADDEVFLLQVGSFKNSHDADSLRARLLLLNLSASIETVSPRRNETWHRVLVGPFSDGPELADARSRLSSNGIESLLLKRKQ